MLKWQRKHNVVLLRVWYWLKLSDFLFCITYICSQSSVIVLSWWTHGEHLRLIYNKWLIDNFSNLWWREHVHMADPVLSSIINIHMSFVWFASTLIHSQAVFSKWHKLCGIQHNYKKKVLWTVKKKKSAVVNTNSAHPSLDVQLWGRLRLKTLHMYRS